MTKAKQAKLNMNLTVKVANFIADNPDVLKKLPDDASFVVFSKKNKKLNEQNTKLLTSLRKKGETIIEVYETEDKKSPWKFSFAS